MEENSGAVEVKHQIRMSPSHRTQRKGLQDKSISSGDAEEHHTCILSFEGLNIICSHKQLEAVLVENHWRPVTLCKYAGWREYHYYKPKSSSVQEDILLKKVRLPEPIEDAPKQKILKFVRKVNEMAKRNILCAWVHKGPKIVHDSASPNTDTHVWKWVAKRGNRI